MSKHSALFTAASLLVFAGNAAAETAPLSYASDFEVSPAQAAADMPDDRLSFELTADWVSAYYFRGIIQEDDGFIIQPSATLTFNIATTDNGSVDWYVGTWHSFHSEGDTAGTGGGGNAYYELDVYTGIAFTYGSWSFDVFYTNYSSPSDAFSSVNEVAVSVGYDDSENGILFGIPIYPYITVAGEVDGNAFGTNEGVYVELGIEPGMTLEGVGMEEVGLSFPVTLGLSGSNYYDGAEDDVFGYVQFGASLSVPLPIDFGEWTLSAGIYGLVLGDDLETANSGDSAEVIGTVGLSWAF